MTVAELTDPDAVRSAIAEFDAIGRVAFLTKYGFGEAKSYFVVSGGHEYDSKALLAAAHGFQHPAAGPLRSSDFSGGEATVAKKFRSLGFVVVDRSNPDWTIDELILAFEVYRRRGMLSNSDVEVVELSELLNRLPIHRDRPKGKDFRNANGVTLKLANFASADPAHPGKGMSRRSKLEDEVWARFASDPAGLTAVASQIRLAADDPEAFEPGELEPDEVSVAEGELLYRRHRSRERDPKVVRKKKASVLGATGRLACEVCGFDFARVYGSAGSGFIECHHVVPLSESGATTTGTDDLALLCANCHRMIHRIRPWLTVDRLIEVLAEQTGSR